MANRVTVPHGIGLVRPWPVLERFVRYYADRNARLGDTVVVHPVHARAAPILDFKFGEDAILFIRSDGKPPLFSPRVVLIGMQTHRRGKLHFRGTVDGFAIVFQPSALGLLFALPAREFTDQDFDAEQVFGAIIARFHERLADCRTFEERISVANQFLVRRALAALPSDGILAASTDIIRGAVTPASPPWPDAQAWASVSLSAGSCSRWGSVLSCSRASRGSIDRMARSPQGSWKTSPDSRANPDPHAATFRKCIRAADDGNPVRTRPAVRRRSMGPLKRFRVSYWPMADPTRPSRRGSAY